MITLYELHWSHYCEKIRLTLHYMGLEWRMVGIDAFSKRQLREHPLPSYLPSHTVPAIHDARTGRFVMDSTPNFVSLRSRKVRQYLATASVR
ncbi:hypothetical protein SFMTTN_0187 [Sulfuriferula multivorans]|uniref:GST N-terminal domain-containing protein n=1 Tax=Sulfuriferula multivorans TaxID=1559896 RepID=A0A401J9Q9_9PROT|nr:glutathione S-transferase N-terminal domain-containing protein [Sulfuriferula multivorans]GBL44392.1 hypothetical protein SFMTTN_0187 [Sulfuriferula multivorans]